MEECEKKAGYYDRFYRDCSVMKGSYQRLAHFPLFVRVLQYINTGKKDVEIIELGCGTGQLAEYLADEGKQKYTGIDFSEVGLDIARQRSKQKFIQYDLNQGVDTWLAGRGAEENKSILFLATEVLEHIQKDLELVAAIPEGVQFIFSVPDFSCEGHVRYFKTQREVFERYGHLLLFLNESFMDGRYIINSIRKVKTGKLCGTPVKTLNIAY